MPTGSLSFDDIRDLLRSAVNAAAPSGKSAWIRTVYADSVIYDLDPSGPNALPGPTETLRRPYTIDDVTQGVTLGDAEPVRQVTTYETVAPAKFSIGPGTADGATVTRPGKLFETGVWGPAPNRPAGFSLNDDEAKASLGYTVPLEIEHVRSVLDGKLGTATFTAFNGKDIDGYLTLPKALNDLVGPENALPVSVVWDTATKKPLRVGIVLNPQITDAQVAAAFSASDAEAVSRKGSAMKPTLLQRIAGVFATSTPAEIAAFTADVPADPTPAATPAATPDPALAAANAEIDRLRAQVAANESPAIEAAASRFAADAVAADKITPAEEAEYAAMFSQAVLDDAAGQAAFSADGTLAAGPRVARLRDVIAKRAPLGLTGEKLGESPAEFSAVGGARPPEAAKTIDTPAIYARMNGQEASK